MGIIHKPNPETRDCVITQDVRDYAEKHGLTDSKALEEGMDKKAQEFKDKGNLIYQ